MKKLSFIFLLTAIMSNAFASDCDIHCGDCRGLTFKFVEIKNNTAYCYYNHAPKPWLLCTADNVKPTHGRHSQWIGNKCEANAAHKCRFDRK